MLSVGLIDTHPVIRVFSFRARFEDELVRAGQVGCCRSRSACCSRAGTGSSPLPTRAKSLPGPLNVRLYERLEKKLQKLRGRRFAWAIRY